MEQDDKFERFLKKLNLVELERFDMSFDMAQWDIFDRHLFRMVIRKNTPWSYEMLSEFLNALFSLDFKYDIIYEYDLIPTPLDAYRLLTDWHFSHKLCPFLLDYKCENDDLIIFSEDETSKNMLIKELEPFLELMKKINYKINIVFEINEKTVANIIAETKEESDEEDLDIDFDSMDGIEDSSETGGERVLASQHQVEKELLEEIKTSKSITEKERRSNRGGYIHYKIRNIDSNSGNVDFDAKVFSYEERNTKKNSLMILLGVADDTGAIYVRFFENSRLNAQLLRELKPGMQVRIRGEAQIDKFSNELVIMGRFVNIFGMEEIMRSDASVQKRVELHLHSKMSTMDGVTSISSYCKLAKHMGHTAIALTDHGVVQSFPEAQKAAKDNGLKMIYGCELYMIEDELSAIFNPSKQKLTKASYVVYDFETTGLSSRYDDIIEFGAVKIIEGLNVKAIDILINPKKKISAKITNLTGITNEMVKDKPTIEEAIATIRDFIGDSILVSHNAEFDFGFLNEACRKLRQPIFTNPVIDTLSLSRFLFPEARNHRLGSLCRNLEITYDDSKAHRADYDANVLNEVWQAMIVKLTKENHDLRHCDLADLRLSEEHLKHLRPKHVVALVKNEAGLKDLFKLVSFSHLDYFADVPKIPRSLVSKHRQNLLLGSACFNGEVFDSAATKSKDILKEKIAFYDFIEIQPLENYSYLINMGNISDEETLKQFVLDIIEASEEMNKMVVATGDCHYLDPEDKIYRDVFIAAKAIGNTNHPMSPYARDEMDHFENPDQHYRSTDEMLQAFSWLGEDKAHALVITNSNDIADRIENITPIKDKLYTPKIENCEQILQDLCYDTAHKLYGNPLPKIVKDRLETELNGIIKHQYSVIYYIAHKIVKTANDEGFMVGSRGSVGSSFVATMAMITEVNPLPPHYRCPKCKFSEFVEHADVTSGYDLPDKVCPVCGHQLIHDGQNIPFATFLGFNAEKVPDIDLNFPGDYQALAHNLTKELLGAGNVYKAGTIEKVADKTAFGYAKGYFERVGQKIGRDLATVSKAEIAYLAAGCTDVRRTTGQHPGGIIVIPDGYEVYDFTPIQYPADDKEAAWKTTHFDFRAIHDNVLKLDLLGHVDPLALKLMADMSGIDVGTLPMNDPEVISLFSSDRALRRHSNFLKESTGALGLPEFGTDITRAMLKETQPKSFSDLLIISGLSHGTDVWKGNAQELIRNKTCTLREVIGCRDDIMTYLSEKGVEPALAFKIMEDVRKGKKLKPDYEVIMKDNNIPQYYIDSCNKIKYMFPKAHATAYVMMAIRVGWFKVHRPLIFYATFFSVRSRQFDLAAMIGGEEEIIKRLGEIAEKKFDASAKEQEIEKTLIIALEMAERGFKMSPIDLYKSDSTKFIVDEETQKIIPPFSAVDGLGENAAISIIEARVNGKFLSKQDLSNRTKVNSQSMSRLEEFHVLDELDETNQMSLFSFFPVA